MPPIPHRHVLALVVISPFPMTIIQLLRLRISRHDVLVQDAPVILALLPDEDGIGVLDCKTAL